MRPLAAAAAAPHRGLRRRLRLAAVGVLGTIAVACAGTAAWAIPPGGAVENPGGASAAAGPSPVPYGGVVTFTGTGFDAGESVSVKVDDGRFAKKGGGDAADVLAVVTATGSGSISGSVDLSQLDQDTPQGAFGGGDHWLRFLSGKPRSLKASFTVSSPPATPTPTATPTPAAQPGPSGNAGQGGSTGSGSTGSGSTGSGSGGGTVGAGSTQSAAGAPPVAKGGVVQLTATALRVKGSAVAFALKSGAAGSAGTVRIRTRDKVVLGSRPKRRLTIARPDSYLVEPVKTATIKLKLTAEGKALFRRKRSIAAVVEVRDASEEGNVDQPVVIRR